MNRVFAGVIFSALLSGTVLAQTAAPSTEAVKAAGPPPAFDVADVRPSAKVRFASLYYDGGVLMGDRFVLRQASVADLIARAYGIRNYENIQGGPAWLERNRYNIIAKTKANTPPATVNLMLKSLLGIYAGPYLYYPPLDATGLKGGWDLTVSFSGLNKLKQSAADSDPNGAVTIFTAVNKQLGLKLEKQKRSLPVLVIDHIDETPTEN